MKQRTGYLALAVSLTLLYAVVAVYCGMALWKAWPETFWIEDTWSSLPH